MKICCLKILPEKEINDKDISRYIIITCCLLRLVRFDTTFCIVPKGNVHFRTDWLLPLSFSIFICTAHWNWTIKMAKENSIHDFTLLIVKRGEVYSSFSRLEVTIPIWHRTERNNEGCSIFFPSNYAWNMNSLAHFLRESLPVDGANVALIVQKSKRGDENDNAGRNI